MITNSVVLVNAVVIKMIYYAYMNKTFLMLVAMSTEIFAPSTPIEIEPTQAASATRDTTENQKWRKACGNIFFGGLGVCGAIVLAGEAACNVDSTRDRDFSSHLKKNLVIGVVAVIQSAFGLIATNTQNKAIKTRAKIGVASVACCVAPPIVRGCIGGIYGTYNI